MSAAIAHYHDALHQQFLSILPRIELHARFVFRHLKCRHQHEEAVADVIGLTWMWYVRLVHRGKDPHQFVSALAAYAARAVKSERRVNDQGRPRDVLSRLAQQRHCFTVSKLHDCSTLSTNPLCEALADNTRSPVADQAAFRIDFPAWLSTWDQRRRDLIIDMAQGEQTQDLAASYKVSPARISQMRREFHRAWEQFHGEV